MMESFGQSTHKEVLEACVYISMHVDRKISLDEIAQKLFLNPSYFSRLFKKEVGITFVEYIKKLKMERAKELLNETQLTIGEISERVGYDGQSYFIKLFKQHEGVTPIEYRRVNAAKPC
ncbi:helix-turn-helix domain-containing protein [Amphibacillus sediminis]|uniref:helix-turn-helix domain-containing protein n=1 Tax=Amphibacillus sediminis TaxID=360185 RepID=UPI000834CF0C|nr:AraC family transcriptional regulator [Amphibacillus sediminis]